MVSRTPTPEGFYEIMANAYRHADAMMKAREQEKP